VLVSQSEGVVNGSCIALHIAMQAYLNLNARNNVIVPEKNAQELELVSEATENAGTDKQIVERHKNIIPFKEEEPQSNREVINAGELAGRVEQN